MVDTRCVASAFEYLEAQREGVCVLVLSSLRVQHDCISWALTTGRAGQQVLLQQLILQDGSHHYSNHLFRWL